jgi:hypothetical protein
MPRLAGFGGFMARQQALRATTVSLFRESTPEVEALKRQAEADAKAAFVVDIPDYKPKDPWAVQRQRDMIAQIAARQKKQ